MINIKEDRGPLDLTLQIEKLKQKVHDAELETSLVKAIGINSPEMKAARKEIYHLKKDLSQAREDHQFDNIVHQKELEDLRQQLNPLNKLRKSGL